MTNQEAWKLYEKYVSAWNTTSIDQRLEIANEVLSENIEYQTARASDAHLNPYPAALK